MYHIRLTSPEYLSSNLLVQFARAHTVQHILVEEGSDLSCKQTHNHLHADTHYKNDQAYRRVIKKTMPNLSGNKHYSLKLGDEKGYYYVCKGTGPDWDTGKPTVLSTTFSEDAIKEFHRMYWKIFSERDTNNSCGGDVIQVDMSGLVPDKPKKRTKMFMEKIRDELIDKYPDHLWDMQEDTDLRFLTRYLRQKLGATAKNIDDNIFMRMFSGLYNGLPRKAIAEDFEQNHYEDLARRRYR